MQAYTQTKTATTKNLYGTQNTLSSLHTTHYIPNQASRNHLNNLTSNEVSQSHIIYARSTFNMHNVIT